MHILKRLTALEEQMKPPERMLFLMQIDDDGTEHWKTIDDFIRLCGEHCIPIRTHGWNSDDFDRYLANVRRVALNSI